MNVVKIRNTARMFGCCRFFQYFSKIQATPLSTVRVFSSTNISQLKETKHQKKKKVKSVPLAIEVLKDGNSNFEIQTPELPEYLTNESIEDIRSEIETLRKMKENCKHEVKKFKTDKNLIEQLDEEGNNKKDEEYLQKAALIGTANEKIDISDVPCGGCGALLHCVDPSLPGFVSQELYLNHKLEELVCRRCIDVNGSPEKDVTQEIDVGVYKAIFKRIKMEKALVVMVVDVTDLTNSIIPGFVKNVSKRTPLVIVGNKIDLIPKDSDGYLDRVLQRIEDECLRSSLLYKDNIKHICLASAKTGYGIEDLISKLLTFWKNEGNVYVVGITNSGKSSLFNKFLDSDYCKHSCRDVVQRATVSRLPGTTLNVLGFPIMRARKRYMAHRIQRLLAEREMEKELAVARKEKLKREGRSRNATLIGNVGKTEFRSETALEEWVEKYASTGNTFATYSLDNLQDVDESDQVQEKAESWLTARKLVHNEEFPDSCWCYDTPGIVTDQQVTNHLNQTELRHILKRKVIHPRTYVMAPGDTMFVTGLTRIDYLQGVKNTLFTVHMVHFLPVHVMKTATADQFYADNIGTETFRVPVGDEDRLNKLSSLCGTEFTMETEDANFASADLQLSSLGWVSIAAAPSEVVVRAYTPGGRGMSLRSPALLPNIVAFKGTRIPKTKQYQMRKLRM